MKELGEILRRAREAKGISLQQAEQDTRIRKLHLCNIEKGEPTPGLDPSYFRLFVKTYADYLGLEGSRLLIQYLGSAPCTDTAPVAAMQPQVVRQPLVRRPRGSRLWSAALVVLVVLTCCAVVLQLTRPRQAVAPQQAPPEPAPASPPISPISQPQVRLVEKTGVTSVYEVEAEPIQVEIAISSDLPEDKECWISLTADGKEMYQGILSVGSSLQATATKEVRVRSGKPWMTALSVNGVEVGRMGELGPPRNVVVRAK
ncbi:MAG: helix-turn-helix domain-containing protein [Bacillota bacterium]